MNQRKIKKVEVSKLFWRDLDDWRKHPEYHKIRSHIGKMVEKVMNGDPGGDVPFMGNPVWEDIRHIHVGQKLVMFTRYTDDETLRICALKKHDFYGFRRERKNQASNAAQVILRAAMAAASPFPEWGKISWKDPSEIPDHPELKELSRDSLDKLYQEIMEEGEEFTRLRTAISGMSDKNAERISDGWLEDLLKAESAVQEMILTKARHRKDNTPPDIFTAWNEP